MKDFEAFKTRVGEVESPTFEFLVSEDLAREILEYQSKPLPEWMVRHREPFRWTWRLRFIVWRSDLRWAIHKHLFPECDT